MKKLTTFKMRNRSISRSLALGALMSMGSLLSFAQSVTTSLATGTNTTGEMPIYGNYGYNYTQQIYLSTDFAPAMQGTSSLITKVRFFYVSGNLAPSTAWNIYMGSTAQTNFASNTSWVPLASMTQVFSGNVTAPAANSWMEITLSTPFLWDGVSNVVLAIDENTSGWSTVTWRQHATGANRCILYRNDSNNPDPATPPTANSRYSYVAQTQFVHETTGPCSGTPVHANAVTSAASVCSNTGAPVNLSLSGLPFLSGYSYQWEYNDGSGWVPYANSDTSVYATIPTTTMNIRAQVTCDNSGMSDISEEATITYNVAPTLSLNETAVAYCTGDAVTIIAEGADTYAWTPATGLNVVNNDTVIANPVNSTLYTLIGTDLVGCMDTVTALISPLSKIQRTTAYAPTELCAPGTPVTVTATVAPAVINGGGAYEYKFIGADGAILQDWSASNTFNFTPAADSIYKVYTDFRSNSCPDAVDSILTSIVVGFGADVTVVDYDCINLGGTVSLDNVFGQMEEEVVYTNPLANPVTDAANITFNGGAAIVGGRGVVTPSATGIGSASIVIDDPNFHTGSNNAMTVSFKLTADQPINNYGTGGADGITYSFADNLAANANQNGSGSKLRLVFDAAGNSPNEVGIYLVYGNTGGVSSTSVTPTAGTTLFYTPNVNSWKLKTDVQVVLTISPAGKASLTIDGVVIFSNIQMPAAYMNATTTGWKHAFSAATGGDAMRHAVSDVQMKALYQEFAFVPENTTPVWGTASEFTNVQPGTYDLWISSNGSTSCAKKIETIEVVNTNPLVLLGNDTTICEGESLTLDAGNAGATYVWSGSQLTTQTRVVTQSGPYVVNVTAPNGCVGVGSINVSVMDAPTASSIYVQNNMPTYTFTVLNPQNADQYSWDFGDGTTLANAPGTVTHEFTTTGPKMVSVTLTNECGTETVIATVVVTSTADVATNTIEGLNVYPNPANDYVVVELPAATQAAGSVYNMAGSLIRTIDSFTAKTTVSVSDLTPGVYFLHVQSDDKTSVIKLVVE